MAGTQKPAGSCSALAAVAKNPVPVIYPSAVLQVCLACRTRLVVSRLKLMHEIWCFELTASDARGLMLSFSPHDNTSATCISWLRDLLVCTYLPNVSPAACRFKMSDSSWLLQVLILLQCFAYIPLTHCQALASGCGCSSLLDQGVDRGQDLTRACIHTHSVSAAAPCQLA